MTEVVVGALVREGLVLLGHRRASKQVNPDAWDLPGGVVEAGESELVALARELREELGVQIVTDSTSHLCRVTAGDAEETVQLSAWVVRDWHGTPVNSAPDEHDAIGWFSLERLPAFFHAEVRAAVADAMRGRHP
jgi:8-oxo-dGTP diphosphatase